MNVVENTVLPFCAGVVTLLGSANAVTLLESANAVTFWVSADATENIAVVGQ